MVERRVRVGRAMRELPGFRRLVAIRVASQFADGLFGAGLAGALLFNPERAATPWHIAASFAVLFGPYSLLGPFAGALLDRWDRRRVLVGANLVRLILVATVAALLAAGAGDLAVLAGALLVNGTTRFVAAGLSAALPHVVPPGQVVGLNAMSTAIGAVATFAGANAMLVSRWLAGSDDTGAATVIAAVVVPVAVALLVARRFADGALGPDGSRRAVRGSAARVIATGWVHGVRTATRLPTVAAALFGLACHRAVFGINTLLVLVIVRSDAAATIGSGGAGPDVAGLSVAVVFVAATGAGQFLATLSTPAVVHRLGRARTATAALAVAAVVQLAGSTLHLPTMLVCGFVLGAAGQMVKLGADVAMQTDVDDARRGHVFAVQDALFWIAFLGAITAAAAVVPADGRAPALAVAGAGLYAAGLAGTLLLRRRAN